MNFLLITADDMRYDEYSYMPKTRRLLGRTGTTFTGCRTNVPLCSPARNGILTGQYSKHHGVLTNSNSPDSTDYDNSVFVALDNAGYRCGMIGKFFTSLSGAAVKPGFDFWRALQNVTAYGIYDSTSYGIYDGTTTIEPDEHQDAYLSGEALDFIAGAEPWCLWYCPTGPHWPFNNPPGHTSEWLGRDRELNLESDVSDKPSWIQALTAPTATELAELQIEERVRLRELLAVDDAIAAMVAAVPPDTTIIFTSDNGNMLGEHRIIGDVGARAGSKNLPYDESMHVPLVCAGPDFPVATVTQPTTHQDITATMLDLAGATALLGNQAGISLVDIAASPSSYSSRQLLHYRDADGGSVPTADGITTATRKLWRYQGETGTDEFEMYDLDTDPGELTNVANVGGRLTERNALESALDGLLA